MIYVDFWIIITIIPNALSFNIIMTDKKFDIKMLEFLICPVSGGELTYDEKKQCLISKKASLVYPIRDGIPILLQDEARPLGKD